MEKYGKYMEKYGKYGKIIIFDGNIW